MQAYLPFLSIILDITGKNTIIDRLLCKYQLSELFFAEDESSSTYAPFLVKLDPFMAAADTTRKDHRQPTERQPFNSSLQVAGVFGAKRGYKQLY